jgi:hypothetical protein
MMRINLASPLKPGEKFSFLNWWYNINNYRLEGGRSGYELFEKRQQTICNRSVLSKWLYNDVEGWQNMQFGTGGLHCRLVILM